MLTASLATALVSVLSYWLESNPLQALTTLNNLALSFAGNRELLAGVAAMGKVPKQKDNWYQKICIFFFSFSSRNSDIHLAIDCQLCRGVLGVIHKNGVTVR